MNPSDALPEDWGMYYDGVWMRHTTHGVGQVQVIGGSLYLRRSPTSDPIQVQPQYLKCWWPRAGAFNCGERAVYIARRAVRNMRKSAMAGDHYYVSWGSPYGLDIMATLKEGPAYIGPDKALDYITDGMRSSVAVTRDIIFTQCEDGKPDAATVVFKGMEIGTYDREVGLTPMFSGSPFIPRAIRQLEDAV